MLYNNNIRFCFIQTIPSDFKMKDKVESLLETNGFDKKRPRQMDIDDFLGLVL